MALLAVLEPDPRTFARLASALDRDHELIACSRWNTLWDVVLRHPVEGCLLDLDAAPGGWPLRELQRLRRRQPVLALVVYGDFSGRELELFELGRQDIDGVILSGQGPGHREVLDAVNRALAANVALRVTHALDGRLPPEGMDALRWSIENAHDVPGVEDMAEAFSLPERTLARELRARDLPTPRRFLLWGRLFRAAHLLDHPTRTVEEAAYRLGYSSGAALSRALRRETGHPPTEVMRRGGIACVLEAFLKSRRPVAPRRRWAVAARRGG